MTTNFSYIPFLRDDEFIAWYTVAAQRPQEYRERARIQRSIADTLDGCYISKRMSDKLRAVFGDRFKHLHIESDYNPKWKRIYIRIDTHKFDFRVAKTENNRINGNDIRKCAEHDEERAVKLAADLETFFDDAAQYKAIYTAYDAIITRIRNVAYAAEP